jgi:hypothetical protein
MPPNYVPYVFSAGSYAFRFSSYHCNSGLGGVKAKRNRGFFPIGPRTIHRPIFLTSDRRKEFRTESEYWAGAVAARSRDRGAARNRSQLVAAPKNRCRSCAVKDYRVSQGRRPLYRGGGADIIGASPVPAPSP